ncbi:uncharacterized protein FA14DRAFT_68421 [Meira miltonrushii]|uniref:Uncharacterized protein n=1 Tax=Meira miltonrushii TaxID=1280837 RepID=A0A316VCY5_9BASI|nr:uncharacterized protein FA14DRAFT_68421 [Meira miltonrushii]PWN34093.1 hypothetical protein FA14DRAFT_68421 [Meira miltonrushii]
MIIITAQTSKKDEVISKKPFQFNASGVRVKKGNNAHAKKKKHCIGRRSAPPETEDFVRLACVIAAVLCKKAKLGTYSPHTHTHPASYIAMPAQSSANACSQSYCGCLIPSFLSSSSDHTISPKGHLSFAERATCIADLNNKTLMCLTLIQMRIQLIKRAKSYFQDRGTDCNVNFEIKKCKYYIEMNKKK